MQTHCGIAWGERYWHLEAVRLRFCLNEALFRLFIIWQYEKWLLQPLLSGGLIPDSLSYGGGGVGKATPMRRELNYECTGFSGIRWKNELWFCVYSGAEKEDSYNIIPWRQTFDLTTFSLLWAVKWRLLPACPTAPGPSPFRSGWGQLTGRCWGFHQQGWERNRAQEKRVVRFKSMWEEVHCDSSFSYPIDRKKLLH